MQKPAPSGCRALRRRRTGTRPRVSCRRTAHARDRRRRERVPRCAARAPRCARDSSRCVHSTMSVYVTACAMLGRIPPRSEHGARSRAALGRWWQLSRVAARQADDDHEGDGRVALGVLRRFDLFAFDLGLVGRLVLPVRIVIPALVRRPFAASQARCVEPLMSAAGAEPARPERVPHGSAAGVAHPAVRRARAPRAFRAIDLGFA